MNQSDYIPSPVVQCKVLYGHEGPGVAIYQACLCRYGSCIQAQKPRKWFVANIRDRLREFIDPGSRRFLYKIFSSQGLILIKSL